MKHLGGVAAGLVALGAITALWAAESANKVGDGYIVYPADGKQGAVVFSHLAHGEEGAGFKCEACHPAIEKKKGTIKMADLYAGKACSQCHNGEAKGPKSGQAAFKVMESCNGCHMPDKHVAIKPKGQSPGNVAFSHSLHTGTAGKEEGGYSCGNCHPKPFEAKAGAPIGMPSPHAKGGCATCHDGKAASPSGAVAMKATANCMKCHKAGT